MSALRYASERITTLPLAGHRSIEKFYFECFLYFYFWGGYLESLSAQLRSCGEFEDEHYFTARASQAASAAAAAAAVDTPTTHTSTRRDRNIDNCAHKFV